MFLVVRCIGCRLCLYQLALLGQVYNRPTHREAPWPLERLCERDFGEDKPMWLLLSHLMKGNRERTA